MSRRVHGLISLLLFDVACWIGVIAAFLHSVTAGLICGAAMGAGTMMLLAAFCVKCACTGEQCAHMLQGKAAELLPPRPIGPYCTGELLTAFAGGLLLIMVPQVWLLLRPAWFAAYWILAVVAAIEVRLFVCPGCMHSCCPLHIRRDEPTRE